MILNYSHINGCDHFEINAIKSEIDDPVLVKFTACNPDEHNQKLEELFSHGKAVSFDVTELTSNSDGLNLILPQNMEVGKVTLNPLNKKQAIVEIQDSDDNTLISFEDLISIGKSSFSFESHKFNGLIKLNIDKAKFLDKSQKTDTTLTLDYKLWDEQNLLTLKYFEQVYKIYKKLANSNEFRIKIYIDGLEVFSAKNEIQDEFRSNLFSILSYTYHCRILCQILKIDAFFKSDVLFTSDEHQSIYDAIVELEDITTNESLTCTFSLHREDYASPEDFSNAEELAFEREYNIRINNIFNKNITTSVFIRHTFFKVKTRITYIKTEQYHTYKIELTNSDNFGTYKRTTRLKTVLDEQDISASNDKIFIE